jgi:hypothetical protein
MSWNGASKGVARAVAASTWPAPSIARRRAVPASQRGALGAGGGIGRVAQQEAQQHRRVPVGQLGGRDVRDRQLGPLGAARDRGRDRLRPSPAAWRRRACR